MIVCFMKTCFIMHYDCCTTGSAIESTLNILWCNKHMQNEVYSINICKTKFIQSKLEEGLNVKCLHEKEKF